MRKTVITIIALFVGIFSFAQSNVFTKENNFGFGTGFMAKDALIDVIPAIELPPAEPTLQDSLFYFEGLRIRRENQGRFAAAAQDAVWSIEALSSFSEAVGIEISAENTPELWYLVSEAVQDTDNLIVAIKSLYFRQRPYMRWEEPDDGVADRDRLAETSSSPSGHSGLAATIVSILLEIYPSRAAEIIKRGNEFIDARWILGFHYKSDCELGKQLGGYAVSVLHSNYEFQHQLLRAKDEAFKLAKTNHPCFSGIHSTN